MAIKIEYQPAAALLGGVANQAGQGFFQQRQEDRAQTQKNMLLQAQLQDRSRMIDFAMNQQQFQQQQMADMQRMNYAAQMQQQQQQFAAGLAVHQQQNELAFRQAAGAQELALKGMIAFSELDQNERMMQLRNSSQAKAAFEQMNAERQMLQENFDNGYLNQEQFNTMMLEQSKKIAGFRPSDYPLDGPFPPNQGMGDIWDQPVTMPDGSTMSLPHTRNRNGVPEPTYASKKLIDSKTGIYEEEERAKRGLSTNSANGSFSVKDYTSLWQAISKSLTKIDAQTGLELPPDPSVVSSQVDAIINAFENRSRARQSGSMVPPSTELGSTFSGGIPNSGPLTPLRAQRLKEMPVNTPLRKLFPLPIVTSPQEFAEVMLQSQTDVVHQYLRQKYPTKQSVLAAIESGSAPDDVAILRLLDPSLPEAPKAQSEPQPSGSWLGNFSLPAMGY